jgi:hypothetical protein
MASGEFLNIKDQIMPLPANSALAKSDFKKVFSGG